MASTNRQVVSVVIPTRNRLGYLKEAIASVEGQTYDHVELVVVDDASSDGTWDFLRSHSTAHAFRLAEHGERSLARNRGLAEAGGEFVWFLDDDDRLETNAVLRMVDYANRFPMAIAVVGQMRHFRKVKGGPETEAWIRKVVLADVWLDSLAVTVLGAGRCLLRKHAVTDVGGFSDKYPPFEDHYFSLVLSKQGPVALVPDVVAWHRLHSGQSNLAARQELEVSIREEMLETYSEAERRVAQRRMEAFKVVREADVAFELKQTWRALRLYAAALRMDPTLGRSPVLGRTIRLRMIKCLAGRTGLTVARRLRAARAERRLS